MTASIRIPAATSSNAAAVSRRQTRLRIVRTPRIGFLTASKLIAIAVVLVSGVFLKLNSVWAEVPQLTAERNLTTTVATDDREVYVITSRIRGWVPKLGILFHTSVAICPQGVSPIVYENGNPVTNWKRCAVYGTQTNRTGFFREGKRVGVRATRIRGISATEIERRMRCHRQVNVPLFHDCRHHAINVTGLEGALFRRKLPVFLR